MMSSDQGLYQSHHEHDACGIGFVVNIQGKQSHKIVEQALTVLHNLDHRGATGSEKNTGDGAGILLQIPHKFLSDSCQGLGINLPGRGQYGVGMIFLPPGREERLACEKVIREVVEEEEQEVLGWRKVPTDNFYLGQSAKDAEPSVRQLFIGRSRDIRTELEFERKLYVIRRKITKRIENSDLADKDYLYINSLSSRTIIYKGMLTSTQLKDFYPDLTDPKMESALALVHSRFSTNTFPNWKLAHPFRYLIHNGEINTLRGNQNWMRAREAQLSTDLFDTDMDTLTPIIQEDGSDSAKFDNCLEFLLLSGRSLPHAMMMMIPEPWEKHESMDDEMKAFYEYHSCLMEPWDGPASIAFTDGKMVGATLDRNGLRPSRYYVTSDDMIVLSSEVGVLDIPPEDIVYKDRLQPGRMLLIDTEEGRIKSDEEIKHQIAREHPYREWLDENLIDFHDLPYSFQEEPKAEHEDIVQRQKVFGYTYEDLNVNVGPMAEDMLQPVGAMGNDAPIAVLSNEPQLLYNYFKQLFAQVTNPPIDPIREELITSTETILGSEGNILETTPESCRQIRLKTPVLKNEELAQLKNINNLSGFKSKTLPILFDVNRGGEGLEEALEELFAAADKAVEKGVNILILSDRDFNRQKAPIPALLAVAGLHHHLIRSGNRTKVGLVLESGEPRETHHFCTLLGYGVEAVNPYMAYESLHDLIREGHLDLSFKRARKGYNKAVVKGIVKVMSKMGISTIKSYRGAQIFEALGLDKELVDKYFTWTDSRIGGIGLDTIALEAKMRHREAYPNYRTNGQVLDEGGQYKWRKGSEYHAYNPKTVHTLQLATKNGDYELYKEYSNLIDEQSDPPAALRSLLKLKTDESEAVPIEEVESVEEICKRFKTGAMSYGSISKETHEALAIAMNRIGGKSNTGEGGEDPARYTPEPNGDSKNSAVKQVASGRFGVTSEYLTQGKEIQIKMAQGAKPGEGGELPGRKVYPWIADVRLSTPGVGLISPPPHHDIYSIEDLAQLIHDLKNANKDALINVKLVSAVGVGTIATGVAKGHADVILISGHDGGTGASPQTSIKHAGLPWELGLSETHQTLVLNDLRSRVTLETDGQIKTGRDIAVAALLGGEEFGFGTSALITLGCIMMRVCHLDTCPVGIATQNPELRHKFTGDPAYVVNFMKFVAQELREHMAELGFRTIDEMIGRTDKLVQAETDHWKARHLDLSPILHRPEIADNVGTRCMICQNHGLENALDIQTLMDICEPALSDGKSVRATLPIKNTNRVVGTIVGSEVTRRFGSKGLSEDTIHLKFEGSAGQSFGAFIPNGMTLELEGDANDYFGKGLSGGKLILYPPKNARFDPAENIIVGNVSFYGATSGQAYIRGKAGERFCVRNSGLHAVVESVGDHACEYMTGGRVVVLGETGRNFAAGMSGGIAYILDLDQQFHKRCNTNRVVLEQLRDEEEIDQVYEMIRRHAEYTDSHRGWRVLAKWDEMIHRFVKVLPKDFKKMQQSIEKAQQEGLDKDEAEMEAFLQNK